MDKIQRINRDFYDQNAKKWAATKADSFYAEAGFRAFLKYVKRGTILDIGCAQGRDIPLFLGIGRHLQYEGFDVSESLLQIARSRYPHLKFYKGNLLEKKTLPKKKYAGFWAVSTLQHIPTKDWDLMLSNLSSLMKRGAIGFFSIPNDRPNPASDEDPRHFSLLSDGQIRAFIKKRGWKLLKRGTLPSTRRTTSWRWYIVSLS